MFVAIVIVPLVAIVHWLFSIRPYCRRNGKGFTPGANIGVTYWADWQQITRDRNNQKLACAADRMPMDGESWMPRETGWTRLGLNFRDPLTCAPGGSAPPLEELRSLYEHLQARILEMFEPSWLVLRRAKDASSTACGETPQLREIHRSAGRIATIFTSQTA